MADLLSQNLAYLTPSETVAISAEAKRRRAAGEDVIDLGAGEPDFDTPGPVANAGIAAIERGMTRYPPNAGIPELRRAIADDLARLSSGRPVDPDRIIVSTGSKQALFNACFALFGPKDKVLVPAPAWVSYPQMIRFARAEPVLVEGDPEWGLKVGVADLERHRDKLVRGLILCSPNNPTGSVYTRSELQSIAQWANRHGIWLISDEIYRRIHFGSGSAPSVLDLPDALLERTVVIVGASKAYAMTGWRIGAALAPPRVVAAMAALQSHTTTGANHPAQWAAVAAFSDPRVEQEVLAMVAAFRRRRDMIVERFRADAPGVEFVEPHGAFYFLFRVDGLRHDGDRLTGRAFCSEALEAVGVALVPGAAFGDDRWARLSYAIGDRDLERALDRLMPHLARWASRAA